MPGLSTDRGMMSARGHGAGERNELLDGGRVPGNAERGALPQQAPAGASGVSVDSLDQTLVRGVAWTSFFKWSSQALSWVSTIVVARILTPHDYGIVAMSRVYVDLAQLINEGGLGVTVIQHRELSRDALGRLGGVAVALGVVMALISVALARPAAWFFNEPAVAAVTAVLGLGLVLEGFQNVGRALMVRQLRFKETGALEAVQMLVNTAITLSLAVAGAGYWAIVVGTLGAAAGGGIFVLLRTRLYPRWPGRARDLTGPIKFGAKVLTSNLAWWVFRSADITVVGRWLGGTAAGFYSFGWTIAAVPTDRIGQVVNRVAPPVLSASQNDLPALRRYVLRLTEGVSLLTFPLLVGLALVADDLVRLTLGDRWLPAVPVLAVLALAGIVRTVLPLLNQSLLALHEATTVLWATVALAIAMPVFFYIGTTWGVVGVAGAWLVGYPPIAGFLLAAPALRRAGIRLSQYVRVLAPAAVGTVVMAVAVTVTRWSAPQAPAVRLLAEVGAGTCAYSLCLLIFWPDRVRTYLALVGGLRKR